GCPLFLSFCLSMIRVLAGYDFKRRVCSSSEYVSIRFVLDFGGERSGITSGSESSSVKGSRSLTGVRLAVGVGLDLGFAVALTAFLGRRWSSSSSSLSSLPSSVRLFPL